MDSTQQLLHEKGGGNDVNKVEELDLKDCVQLNGKLASLSVYSNLQVLFLDSIGLTSLSDFPALPKLKILSLRDNKLSNDITPLSQLLSLTHLDLSGNNITRIDVLRPLEDLISLVKLELAGCPVTKTPDYRSIVFDLLHKLKVLDGLSYNDEEEGGEEDGNYSDRAENGDDEEKNGHEVNIGGSAILRTYNDRHSESEEAENGGDTDPSSEEFDENAPRDISEIAKLLHAPLQSDSDSEGSDFQLGSGSSSEEDDEYNEDEDEDENVDGDEEEEEGDVPEKHSHSVGEEDTQEDSQKGNAPEIWSGEGSMKRKSDSLGSADQFQSSKKRSR
eukprot:TRINITY_DN3819_c0_g2_i2.p1 TRINITY_DN3819_c0_g2~~TRINITY_DN3819_c0_g2_i2.p1  ORF type:complete len:332 (-),score=97.82 TRINITY_DN3819_c0_g2_i2:48-1043(-)